MALTSINADGWTATYGSPPDPDFDPVGSPETFSVTRGSGFSGTTPANPVDPITIYRRLRQAYPNQATKTTDQATPSDFIYSGDTISGVTNNSTIAAPLPLAQWLHHDLDYCGTSTFTARLFVSHAHARTGMPVSAVRFTATDESLNSISVTVTALSTITYTESGLTVPHYAGALDFSSLTAGEKITIDAEIFPWVGAKFTISTDADAYPSPNLTVLKVLNDHNGTFGRVYAWVDGVGGGTPAVSTNRTTAQSTPYATISAALAAIQTYNNTNFGRNETDGGVVVMANGSYDYPGSATFSGRTFSGKTLFVIEGESRAGVTFSFVTTGNRTGLPQYIKWKDCTLDQSFDDVAFNNGASNMVPVAVFQNTEWAMTSAGSPYQFFLSHLGRVWFIETSGVNANQCDYSSSRARAISLALGCSGYCLGPNVYNAIGCDTGLGENTFYSRQASASAPLAVGQVCAYNFITTSNSAISHSEAIGSRGFHYVGNVLEAYTGPGPLVSILSAANVAQQNVLDQLNTKVGERGNLLYSDADTVHTRREIFIQWSISDDLNMKSDVFGSTSAGTGNWSGRYRVGCKGVAALNGDSQNNALGPAEWAGEMETPDGAFNQGQASADFVNDQSVWDGTTRSGKGDYTPGGSSTLPKITAGWAPYSVDLFGTAIANDGSAYAGAVQAAGTGYTLTADGGTLTLTGGDASLIASRIMVADGGSLSLTGGDAALSLGRFLAADGGTLTLSGGDAVLQVARVLAADGGSLSLVGGDATLTYTPSGFTYTLAAEGGALSLSGGDATLIVSRRLVADGGALTLTGGEATLSKVFYLLADGGTLSLSGGSATFTLSRRLVAGGGTLSLVGGNAVFSYSGAANGRAALVSESQSSVVLTPSKSWVTL